MNLTSLFHYVQLVIPVAVTILGGVIAHAVKTPKDSERAVLLSQIAKGAAGLVLSNNRENDWAKLLAAVVDDLVKNPATPTSNRVVLERAATSALMDHGVVPPARK